MPSLIEAQSFYDWKIQRDWKVSVLLGAASYFGELNPNNEINFGPSAGLIAVQRNVWNRIDVRGELGLYYLDYTDERRRGNEPDWNFSGLGVELNAAAVVYLWDESDTRYYERRKFNPYLLLGFAATYANFKADTEEGRIALRDLDIPEEDEYGPIYGSVMAGIGAKYKINYLFNIGIEGAYRYVLSDGFDNHKNRATNSAALTGDFYWIMGIRLETYLPPDIFKSKKSAKYGRVKWFRKFKKEAYWQN
jgi:hypothetical protein